MPVPGLSLIGFMDRDEALQHFRGACVVADDSDAALDIEWNAARAKLAGPSARAGNPEILPIPPEGQQHVAEVAQLPWVAPVLAQLPGATFSLVEIDPLLAFQHNISNARSNHHCAALSQPPTLDELLDACLPKVQINEPITAAATENSVLLKAESLNVRTTVAGHIAPSVVGVQFGLSLPLLHVVRHNGRCYLHNGFHRALGARLAGATHVPCLFRDVATHEEVGIRNDGGTFSVALLESVNPPTLEHFTQGRAYDVQLRKIQRFIHVSWAEYGMATE